jgi:hypothetical protein
MLAFNRSASRPPVLVHEWMRSRRAGTRRGSVCKGPVPYDKAEIVALDKILKRARDRLHAGLPSSALDLAVRYYRRQAGKRGYAALAAGIAGNDTPYGRVANQILVNALGARWNGPEGIRARVTLALAQADFAVIRTTGTIPTIAQIEDYHCAVYALFGIPAPLFGGFAYAALGRDWTGGSARPAERPDRHSAPLAKALPRDIIRALVNLGLAGLCCRSASDTGECATTYAGLLKSFAAMTWRALCSGGLRMAVSS